MHMRTASGPPDLITDGPQIRFDEQTAFGDHPYCLRDMPVRGGSLVIPPAIARPALQPRARWYLPVKLAIEWAGALVLLALLSPVIAALALLVKGTSPGPAFYAQSRLGYGGRKYRIYKLRTMRHDAEVGTGPVWAAKNDCRITPIGRVLRNTHLDELPQLWNVLRGEMALIGPRPERPEIADRIGRDIPEFALRTRLRPGITGLAQMLLPADDPNDTGLHGVRAKLAHDLQYTRNVNVLLDLRIALSTWCYFTSAAVDAARHWLVRPFSIGLVDPAVISPATGEAALSLRIARDPS